MLELPPAALLWFSANKTRVRKIIWHQQPKLHYTMDFVGNPSKLTHTFWKIKLMDPLLTSKMVTFLMIPVGSNIHMYIFIYILHLFCFRNYTISAILDPPKAGFLDQQLLLCLRLNGLGDNVETWRTTGGSITFESLVFPGFPGMNSWETP